MTHVVGRSHAMGRSPDYAVGRSPDRPTASAPGILRGVFGRVRRPSVENVFGSGDPATTEHPEDVWHSLT